MLKQALGLFANKVFQVVRHKVGHIFKLFLCYAALGQGEHPFGLGQHIGDEVSVRMVDNVHTLGSTIAKEVNGATVKKLAIGIGSYHIGN